MTHLFRPPSRAARGKKPGRFRAFTLVELLAVIAIMAILAAVAIPAMRGINAAGQFTQAVTLIASTIDQARSYAVSQSTYVWVTLYTYTPAQPANSPKGLYLAAIASNDGTDPLGVGQGGSLAFPWSISANGEAPTTFSLVSRPQSFPSITYPNGDAPPSGYVYPPGYTDDSIAAPATTPQFSLQISPTLTLGAGDVLAVIQITPSGGVQVDAKPGYTSYVSATSLILQPVLGNNQTDTTHTTKNIATIVVNGLTGLTTVYRTMATPQSQ